MTEYIPNEEFVKKARNLSKAQADYIFSLLRFRLGLGFEEEDNFPLEDIAIQMQREEESLNEWRARFAEVKASADGQH
jgi:hypothetical protein